MKPIIFLIFAAGMLLVSACGNKGPLVLPPPKPTPIQQPANPAAASLPLTDDAVISTPINTEKDNDE